MWNMFNISMADFKQGAFQLLLTTKVITEMKKED